MYKYKNYTIFKIVQIEKFYNFTILHFYKFRNSTIESFLVNFNFRYSEMKTKFFLSPLSFFSQLYNEIVGQIKYFPISIKTIHFPKILCRISTILQIVQIQNL